MQLTPRTTIRLGITAALLFTALPADAEQLPSMAGFQADGTTDVEGVLGLLDARAAGALQLSGAVGAVYGHHYMTERWLVGDGTGNELASLDKPTGCDPDALASTSPSVDCVQVTPVGSAAAPLEHVRLSASASSDENFLRAFTTGGAMELGAVYALINGSAARGVAAPGGDKPDPPQPTGISGHSASENQEPGPGIPYFTTRVSQEDAVFVQSRGNSEILHLRGDFVVEFSGVTVNIADGAQTSTFETGETRSSSPGLQESSQGFLRLWIFDANLRLTHTDGRLTCVFETVGIASDVADLQVLAPRGLAGLAEAGGATVVPAPYAMAFAPGDDQLLVTDEPTSGLAPADSVIGEMADSPLVWTIVAVAAALVVAGSVFRAMTVPPLPKVEAALQSGSYRKAARLSTRILRANPRQESAHLSRAIAWSRAGQNDRIVRHVEPFLRRHEPSDGTIHYVLGLAYLDLGREGDARTMMEEAVARTPSLLAEVSPSLRTTRHEGDAYT